MNTSKFKISVAILLTGTIINLEFSTIIHYLLSRKIAKIELINLISCIQSIASSKNYLMLFSCLNAGVALLALFYYFANNKPYQSELREITPKISTSVSTGQKQFDSAEWLSEKEKDTDFQSYILDPSENHIKNLLKQGIGDFKNIEKGSDLKDEKKEETKEEVSKDEQESSITAKGEATKNISEHQKAILPQGGVVLGCKNQKDKEQIYFIGEDVHTLCIGATRSGKTRTVVLQTIGTLGLAGESMILSDPKGELYQYTYPYLKRLGYEVIAIDFKNPDKSDRYNFLQPVMFYILAECIWKIKDIILGHYS